MAVLAGTGVFGRAIDDQHLRANPIAGFIGDNSTWSGPVAALVSAIIAVLALRWLIAVLTPATRTGTILIAGDRSTGRTTMRSGALADALTSEAAAYRGVALRSRLGGRRAPQPRGSTSPSALDENTDLVVLRHRKETEALAHARQALAKLGRLSRPLGDECHRPPGQPGQLSFTCTQPLLRPRLGLSVARDVRPSADGWVAGSNAGRIVVMDIDSTTETGVVFPHSGSGRSTSAFGRAVVADALRGVDPLGARAAEAETSWRREYRVHFRRLVEAGLLSVDAAVQVARAGMSSLYARMRLATADGELELAAAPRMPVDEPLRTATVAGSVAAQGELVLPYQGERLRGSGLLRRLDAWAGAGIIEPSCAYAVRMVLDNPDWLRLAGRRIVVLGAGAEMSPLTALLRWGAEVVAVDLPRPAIWQRLLGLAHRYAGRLHVPVATAGHNEATGVGLGVDLIHESHRVAGWLADMAGPLVLGNYVYAEGAEHVRATASVDALGQQLLSQRRDITLAFLATPTDVFAVPRAAVAEADRRWAAKEGIGRVRRPLRIVSGGRLLARNYPPGADPGINDSLVLQQGPNYALAKRLQRWRATAARSSGTPVSLRIAPSTRTRSVVRNRLLAAAFAGAHRFGVEVFEPATSNTLMAALLVHDLCASRPADEVPWREEAFAAAHGGLWRQPYAPRSVLGIAALLGVGAARG